MKYIILILILVFSMQIYSVSLDKLTDINTSIEDDDLFLIYEVSANYGERNKKLTFGNFRYQIWRTLPNNTYAKAKNFAGTDWIDLFKLNTSDEIEFAQAFVYSGGIAVVDTTSSFGNMTKYNTQVSLDDHVDMAFFTGVAGTGTLSTNSGATWANFSFLDDGTVTLISCSADVGLTNGTDAKFNIYDGGTGIVFENQLGSTMVIVIEIIYYTP